ncbi:hypothetical protein CsSME_00033323 [Camellia sinensis var. sinensis]
MVFLKGQFSSTGNETIQGMDRILELPTYHEQRIPIHEFRLSLTLINEWTSIIDNWIGILLQNHIKELELQIFPANDQGTRYTLPQTVFTAKSLTALKLHQCLVELSGCSGLG